MLLSKHCLHITQVATDNVSMHTIYLRCWFLIISVQHSPKALLH